MSISQPRSGYTLPVFACAAAVAALQELRQQQTLPFVTIDLIEPATTVEIAIEQTARLEAGSALAIAKSDPGDNLDLTRDTPVWALVELTPQGAGGLGSEESVVIIKGGEGIGKMVDVGDKPAIYAYAQKLLRTNLERLLEPGEKIQVTIILPEGRRLAERTSNAAFGVVEGLSLLGTTGISQPLSAPGQLDASIQQLRSQAYRFDSLVFCVGENGLDLAEKLGINPERLIKTANWIGPLLVEAGLQGVKKILLFGYHGKLIKLAGGIFHTHHHLADARLEILTAHCANLGLPTSVLQTVFASPTAEAVLKYLRDLDAADSSDLLEDSYASRVTQVYGAICEAIERRSQEYIFNHSDRRVTVGSILFDRDRQIIIKSKTAATLLKQLC
ncbi:MAG TPA: cobalt-precorrin-5B (C(1))-methyltransferase [Cyanobacteria bacterium UBA11049]|nr:cobalt-precorrin-5B (C(1))-methyltransferase [Cyanobacteria bacterium UBA11049]